MQRVYGEYKENIPANADIVQAIKDHEIGLGLNAVPDKFVIRKLGIRAESGCNVIINGRPFSIAAQEPLEFGYDCIKVESLTFDKQVSATIRYMYFREDKIYQ